MSTLYAYCHKRLHDPSPGFRQAFIKTLVKRLLKSVARSTGGRIHRNKWLALISQIVATTDLESGGNLLNQIDLELQNYIRTHAQTILKSRLMLEFIRRDFAPTAIDVFTDSQVIRNYEDRFAAAGILEWLDDVAVLMAVGRVSCGHYIDEGRAKQFFGSKETHVGSRLVCAACAAAAVSSGERVQGRFEHEYYMAAYAISVVNGNNDTYIGDKRNPAFRFNQRYNIWHDSSWHPYRNLIDSYHSSRHKGFHVIDSPWVRSHRRAFGCELEVQVVRGDAAEAAGRVHEVLNTSLQVGEYCYFERDGSIGNGFELITQPAGLDVHAQKFALFLNDVNVKKGMRSHEGGSCGFHVHVGREYVTQAQIYRIQSFLNDVRNEALVRSIARRYSNGYCRYKPELAKFSTKDRGGSERYEALNICNENTIEFRIFRGSLRYESIMAALEFVNAILTFCTPGETSFMDFHAVGFKRFLMRPENKPDTKHLRKYLSLDSLRDDEAVAA